MSLSVTGKSCSLARMEETPAYDKVVADNITAVRARHRLSQKAVAERMTALGFEWRQQMVTAVETGRRRLTVAELIGLAYALQTSAGVLMEPPDEIQRIALPSGHTIEAASVAYSVRHFNDGTIEWNDNVPTFTQITESRRSKDVMDAAIGPMARYGRYIPGRESKGPTPDDLDNWREFKEVAEQTEDRESGDKE